MQVVVYLLLAIIAFFLLNYLLTLALGLLFWVAVIGGMVGFLYLIYKLSSRKKNRW